MKKIKNEKGQSLVEMAVSLVLLLLLLSGAVEFGLAFFQFIQLRDAVQEGAFYGSIAPADSAGITSRTQHASNSPIDLTTLTPTITYTPVNDIADACEHSDPNTSVSNGIKVTLTYQHKIFMPFMSGVLGRTTIPLKASVTDTILSPGC